jgi:hypothetical protein
MRCTRQVLLRKTDRKSTDDRAQVLLPPLQELRVHLEDYLSLTSRRVRIKRVYSGQVSADYQLWALAFNVRRHRRLRSDRVTWRIEARRAGSTVGVNKTDGNR